MEPRRPTPLGYREWGRRLNDGIHDGDLTRYLTDLISDTGQTIRAGQQVQSLVPVLRELILRPDTPLNPDIKQMIAGQLDNAEDRFATLCEEHDTDRAQE